MKKTTLHYLHQLMSIFSCKSLLLLAGLLLLSIAAVSQNRAERLAAILHDANSEKVLVVAHRGDWRHAPENSLQAYLNCITMGADMVEVDIQRTKDNQYILMHDRSVDRTTNGKGKIADKTLEEIKQLFLKDADGNLTTNKIPTLRELLLATKGKILINIDKGYDYFKGIYDILVETETLNHVIIKSRNPYQKVKEENEEVLKNSIYMPVISLDKEGAETIVDGYLEFKPLVIECVFKNFTPEVDYLMKKIRKNGIKIWINSLWDSLNGGHSDYTAVEKGKPDESWGWILKQGTTLIQSDNPTELIQYLEKQNRR